MALPIIQLKDIPADGLTVDASIDAGWLRRELETTGFEPASDPAGTAHVRVDLSGRDVILTGNARVKLRGECVRCLAPVELEVAPEFTLHLVPAPTAPRASNAAGTPRRSKHAEVELSAEELDQDVYEDERVDLGHWVREQILLEAPAHPTCPDACANPIVAPQPADAAGERHAIDPRLAPLQNLVTKKKE